MSLARRSLLAAGTAATVLPWLPRPAAARAPLAGRQVPGVHRLKVGGFEVTALLDGHLDIGRELFAKGDPGEMDRLQEAAFLPKGPAVRSPVNAFAVSSGDRLVLIDTGTASAMGPGLGHLPESLQAAGIDPATVDAVLLTHMHPDHANGLLTPQGVAAFANAEVLVAQAEAGFWLDDATLAQAPAGMKPYVEMARAAVKPYQSRLRTFAPGEEVMPGIGSVAAPGHTPGHTAYRVASGDAQLLVWGDIVHVAAFQLAHPDWSIGFDSDPNQAMTTRQRMLDMVAAERMAVAGMHLPFPGLGHVARAGQGYAFVPMPFLPLT